MKAYIVYNNPAPHPRTSQFISKNFNEILKTDTFNDLSKQDLMQLIANLNRNKVQESSLYRAIINWVKHSQNRCAEFVSLFLLLDLQNFSIDFVLNTIAEEPLIQASKDCLNAILSCCKIKHTQQQGTASRILCFGGTENTNLIEIYNSVGKSQSNYPDFPLSLTIIHSTLKLDDFLYCLGEQFLWVRPLAYRLNLKVEKNSQWEEIASMNEERREFAAATWNKKIVVTGGYNTVTLNSAKLYELHSNKWKNIAPMICARYKHALVVANNKLFAIGGTDSRDHKVASVEQLNNENGKWKEIKSMNIARTSFAAATCNNFIYAIGGLSSNNAVKTVERYDLDNDDWSFVKSMNVERMEHAACVLGGKIFVVGGNDQIEKAIRTIDCYDPGINSWKVVGETEQNFICHSIVVI